MLNPHCLLCLVRIFFLQFDIELHLYHFSIASKKVFLLFLADVRYLFYLTRLLRQLVINVLISVTWIIVLGYRNQNTFIMWGAGVKIEGELYFFTSFFIIHIQSWGINCSETLWDQQSKWTVKNTQKNQSSRKWK